MIKTEKKEKTLSLLETEKENLETKRNLFFTYIPLENKFLQKKIFEVRIEKDKKNNCGFWTKLEHNKFIDDLYLYNCNWIKIESYLKNRTCSQIVSHAQKFYLKLKAFKDEELGLDFTSSHIKDLKDIIKIIKEKESLFDINKKLLYIISEKLSFGRAPRQKEEDELIFKLKKQNQQNNLENKNINNIDLIDNINANNNLINNANHTKSINQINFENISKNIDVNGKLAIKSLAYYNLSSSNYDSEEDYESIFTIKNNSIDDLIFLKK